MDEIQEFQGQLKTAIINADPKLNREELLSDIFKSYVAKLFELSLLKSKEKNRIPFEALVEIKSRLINSFRGADLSEYQKSTEWYEDLFEKTIKEILNDAASAHSGQNQIERAPERLEINSKEYMKQSSGLYMPASQAY